jgi:cellulose biosynthesis protein BcsQ
MAIIAFWSGEPKECGQTLSMTAVATYMCVEHNYKTLMVNATFQNDTLERCFWNIDKSNNISKQLNQGKIDIASGAEGLVSAIASNKATPEVISNYTKVVFKNRLDVLPGLKTPIREEFEKSLMLYKDLLNTADKCYDFVFVDVPKTLDRDTTKAILNCASIVVYVMPQNLRLINKYIENSRKMEILRKNNVIPLLAREDNCSKYNSKNAAKYIGQKGGMASVPYNSQFMEAACEAQVGKFFLQTKVSNVAYDKNNRLIQDIQDVDKRIIYKLQELQYLS